MANDKVKKAIEALKKEFDKIWLSEPVEVRRLKEDPKLAGAFKQKGSVLLYPNFETAEIQLYLFYFKSMAKAEEVAIEALSLVLSKCVESKANQWRRYYGMDETPSLMEEAALALKTIKDKEDLVSIIDALHLYLGRLSIWFDSTIPWASVCSAIEWNLK